MSNVDIIPRPPQQPPLPLKPPPTLPPPCSIGYARNTSRSGATANLEGNIFFFLGKTRLNVIIQEMTKRARHIRTVAANFDSRRRKHDGVVPKMNLARQTGAIGSAPRCLPHPHESARRAFVGHRPASCTTV